MPIAKDMPDPELLDEDVIESRIGVHDSNHFEVKLDYSLSGSNGSQYTVDCYFFVPASLGINTHTYRAQQFYNDIQAYIRFKTPTLPLTALAKAQTSPIRRIETLVANLRQVPHDHRQRRDINYELRMVGCIVRANIRDRVSSLRNKLGGLREKNDINDVLLSDSAVICEGLVSEVRDCMQVWRGLRPSFVDGQLPPDCCETFAYVDEYLNRVVEVSLASVIRRVDSISDPDKKLHTARTRAKDLLLSERRYRKEAGYSTNDGENEDDHFVYRQGLLKKFVMSVLWLSISKEKEGRRAANIGAAIAAGAAMFFALIATLFASDYYGINSWNFILAGVVTYILKDRIKDGLKTAIGSRFSQFTADYNTKIRDPISGERIGTCRETFSYTDAQHVPASVLRCRRKDQKVSIEEMAKPEHIFHYCKQVRLQRKNLSDRLHLEQYDLNDIVRFSLWEFLMRADDPTSAIPYFEAETDSVVRRNYRKVYHLNIVMVLASKDTGATTLKRVRVIFDKSAIRELQEVA